MPQKDEKNRRRFGLRVVHVLAIEGHDVVEHSLGLDSRTVWVKLYGSYVTVDGFVPLRLFTKGISLFVPLLSGQHSN